MARRSYAKGGYVPRCLPDGTYDEVQCAGGYCWCSSRSGSVISVGAIRGWPSCATGGMFFFISAVHLRFKTVFDISVALFTVSYNVIQLGCINEKVNRERVNMKCNCKLSDICLSSYMAQARSWIENPL